KMALSAKWIFSAILGIIAVILGNLYIFTLDKNTRAKLLRGQFVIVIQTLMFVGSKYIYKHLFIKIVKNQKPGSDHQGKKDHERAMNEQQYKPSKGIRIWRFIVLTFLILSHLSYFTNLFLIGTEPHWFAMLCYTCLGTFIQLLWCLFLLGIIQKIAIFLNRYNSVILKPKVRASIAIVMALCLASIGIYTVSGMPKVKKVTIPLKNWPQSLEGFRIVQLTDIHLGPTVGKTMLEGLILRVNELDPDLVVLTGDLTDATVERLNGAADPLQHLHGRYGRFFVTGNHEYYTGDVDHWFRHLKSLDFTVLHNDCVEIRSKNNPKEHFCLAGTDDREAVRFQYGDHRMDLPKAVKDCEERSPIILLAHQPKSAKEALQSNPNISLVLSGHTHGGQMFPISIGAWLVNPYYQGLYQYSPHQYVYVSPGTFYFGIPMRIFTSMELTEITIMSETKWKQSLEKKRPKPITAKPAKN
ncbi:unnamed protein product, partial [Owenia fusiformis]